ncbi:hypothetical protein N9B46_02165 [Mariniblastus sp.]|nr:hypothetical protein [Mariniblastus sp.]
MGRDCSSRRIICRSKKTNEDSIPRQYWGFQVKPPPMLSYAGQQDFRNCPDINGATGITDLAKASDDRDCSA